MPLLVQLFLWFFVLPELLPRSCGAVAEADCRTRRSGRRRSASACSCRRASPSSLRAGIGSLPRGQKMAATALGLTTVQTYRYVLLPMAFRIILPPLTSEFLNTIKNTAVAITIGLIELTGEARVDAGIFVSGVRGLHRRDRDVSADQHRRRHRHALPRAQRWRSPATSPGNEPPCSPISTSTSSAARSAICSSTA